MKRFDVNEYFFLAQAGDTAKDIAIQNGFKEIAQMIPDPSNKKVKLLCHYYLPILIKRCGSFA